ncbi:hypothetical protein AB0D37_08370 [Streptomyces sp. NPDC048384]|uniref:hypothetical protein n=1 Tax=Streptomyces sp. NPDC048384 TaxID=3155487 RepID=UPI0034454FEE
MEELPLFPTEVVSAEIILEGLPVLLGGPMEMLLAFLVGRDRGLVCLLYRIHGILGKILESGELFNDLQAHLSAQIGHHGRELDHLVFGEVPPGLDPKRPLDLSFVLVVHVLAPSAAPS